MKSLDQLGRDFGTDKAGDRHNYLRHYAALLESRRQQPTLLLELGVESGASLRMWEAYLPQGTIVGIDNQPECQQQAAGRVHVRIGNQSDPEFLLGVLAEFGRPRVIIDDGSHNGDDQRASFEILYPHLPPSGLYIVEDLHTAYFGWGSSFVKYVTAELLDQVVWPGGATYSHGHGDPRNHWHWPQIQAGMGSFARETKAITFLSSMVVFTKWPEGESFA